MLPHFLGIFYIHIIFFHNVFGGNILGDDSHSDIWYNMHEKKLYILRVVSVRSTPTIYPSVHNLKMYTNLKINISSLR